MVNGLGPPGTRSLDEIAEWGCARCGTMNGRKQDKKLADSIKMDVEEPRSNASAGENDEERPSVETDKVGGAEDGSDTGSKHATQNDQDDEIPIQMAKPTSRGRRKRA